MGCCRSSMTASSRSIASGSSDLSEKLSEYDNASDETLGGRALSPKILFAFGSHDTFIFQTTHGRNIKNLPEPFDRETGISDAYGVDIAACAFGRHGKYIGVFQVADEEPIAASNQSSRRKLMAWIKKQVTSTFAIRTLRFNTAADPRTFFAYLNDRYYGPTYRWANLPEACEEELQDLVHFNGKTAPDYHPVQISFGVGGSYIILYSDGEWSSDGGLEHYQELEDVLEDEGDLGVEYVALNPFTPEEYFVIFKNRTCKWRVPEAYADEVERLARAMLPDITDKESDEEGEDMKGHQSVSGFTVL